MRSVSKASQTGNREAAFPPPFSIGLRRRCRGVFGLSWDEVIRAFLGGQAFVAVAVLGLITVFLLREASGFFAQQREELVRYRRSGMEFVDLIREQDRQQGELVRRLGLRGAEAAQWMAAALPLRELANELGEVALEIRDSEMAMEASEITAQQPKIEAAFARFAAGCDALAAQYPAWRAELAKRVVTLDSALTALRLWDPKKPVSHGAVWRSFLFGTRWITASFWQDFYGVVPLFTGSLLVAAISLGLAVPLGIGAAIYVSQIACAWERRVIKPAIEFIAAIPSVLLGFFGIAVLGQALRTLSHASWLAWLPWLPYAERLNALTAGCLLALIAVPTIFTLAEDALASVPRTLREGSYALGASRMQTIMRVIVPAALSGMVSAVLLGLGRVIGETMVVLLCTGNRIAIPDFSTAGLGALVQPVHTMTGIIAQEMGEVVPATLHYRALFVVGLLLFVIALSLNYAAGQCLARYRLPSRD